MSLPEFKSLSAALSQSPDWAPIDRAWRDTEGLTNALKAHIPRQLFSQVIQVRRADPAKGVRGSQVTVVAKNAAAAAKLRLALAGWDEHLRAAGWGIQHIKVVEQRQQSLSEPPRPVIERGPIPSQAVAAMGALAGEVSNEALRLALSRIGRRPHQADKP